MSRDLDKAHPPRQIGLLAAILLFGCSRCSHPPAAAPATVPPQSPTSTQPPIPHSTEEMHSPPTPNIQATTVSLPTPIQSGALTPSGPWLVYATRDDGLFAVNKDGTSLTGISFLPSALKSPYFDGSSALPLLALTSNLDPEVLQPALYLASFPSLGLQAEIPLLDCPHRVVGCVVRAEAVVTREPAWSPDGRFLAFVAANDGPTTDLYVFDASSGTTTRITQGPHEVGNFYWSPDGNWIVHEETLGFFAGGGGVQALWAVSPDGANLKWLYAPEGSADQEIIGWLGESRFVVVDHTMEGNRNARVVDPDTGAVSTLYKGYFGREALDPDSETFAFSPYVGSPGSSVDESGIYYVSTSSTLPRKVDIPGISLYGWDPSWRHFLSGADCDLGQGRAGLMGFSPSGNVTCLPSADRVLSPDGDWEVELAQQVRLISRAPEAATALANVGPGASYDVLWRSDSLGFFLVSDTSLYYVPTEDPLPVLVEDNLLPWTGAVKWVGKGQ